MSRTTLNHCILVLAAVAIVIASASAVRSGTFNPAPYLADADVDVLSRDVANAQFGRDLFGSPYATVVVGNVDIYDRFPYMEARFFQIVSDPGWNRLLLGEVDRAPAAYDGTTGTFGRLAAPRGLSADADGRVFVADTGNDRVLVFQTRSEFDRIELLPLFAIEELSKPYDVAYSDAGTPFDPSDDRLYVANTGRNEIRRYELTGRGARFTAAVGDLGSGDNRFAGPMALTVGRNAGSHTDDVYVSDVHNRRLVRLRDTGSALAWVGTSRHELGLVTSLDTDHWGNVYAAAPNAGGVVKLTASLLAIAEYSGHSFRPRGFHVPFATVTDHRSGERSRRGRGSGVLVEEWDSDNGIRLLTLGVEMSDAAVSRDNANAVHVTLTDHAEVTAEITDPASGRVIARREAGVLEAGPQTIRFEEADYVASWEPGEYRVSVRARSTYDGGETSDIELKIVMTTSGGRELPDRFAILGNTPNPFNPTTTIRFTVPSGGERPYRVRVYDVAGRLVRDLAAGQIAGGLHEVRWDGRDDRGTTVGSGVYLYRLELGSDRLTGKMVMVK